MDKETYEIVMNTNRMVNQMHLEMTEKLQETDMKFREYEKKYFDAVKKISAIDNEIKKDLEKVSQIDVRSIIDNTKEMELSRIENEKVCIDFVKIMQRIDESRIGIQSIVNENTEITMASDRTCIALMDVISSQMSLMTLLVEKTGLTDDEIDKRSRKLKQRNEKLIIEIVNDSIKKGIKKISYKGF